MNRNRAAFVTLLFLLSIVTDGWAQFNPQNPQEPFLKYRIELDCNVDNIANLYGSGEYSDGSYVTISTYAYNEAYIFQYWECDGEVYSRSSSFAYRINSRDVKFVAHYIFKPYNPEEPQAHYMRKISLNTQPEGVAIFNITNGQKYEIGSTVPIFETYRKFGYEFKGWYEGDSLVADVVAFEYSMPDKNVSLVARYEYNPESPENPGEFYPNSCEFLAEPEDYDKGAVSVYGLDKGRAVYGTTVTLIAIPRGDNTFIGWFLDDELISSSSRYQLKVPEGVVRMHIVAKFANQPPTSVGLNYGTSVEIKTYDLLGREVLPDSNDRGPYIIREYLNGKTVRTYKVIK